MKHFYKKGLLLMAMGWGMVSQTWAVDFPKLPLQTPVEGGKYVLVNPANLSGYMSRTSWDGAYYFLGENDSQYAKYAITASVQEDGTFVFTSETGTTLAFPGGSGNLKAEGNDPACFQLQESESYKGMFHIVAGEGQGNPGVIGKMLHLNAGAQYFVISIPGDSWYPDFAGGTKMDPDYPEDRLVDEDGNFVMADSTSTNWGFVLVEDIPAAMMLGKAYGRLNEYEKLVGDERFGKGYELSLKAAEAIYNGEVFGSEEYAALEAVLQAKQSLASLIVKAEETDADALAKAIAVAEEAFGSLSATEEVNAAWEALNKAIIDYSLGLGDITAMGQNMSFEDLSTQNGNMTTGKSAVPAGWTEYVNGELVQGTPSYGFGWHGVNDDCDTYKDGNYGFGIWVGSVPEFELSQKIEGLDNGTYTITAGMMVANNKRTTQRIFGNLNSTLFGSEDGYAQGILPGEMKTYAGLWETTSERELQELSVRAYVYDGTLTFGVRTNGDYAAANRESGSGSGDGWFKVDNFTISKDGYFAEDALALVDYLMGSISECADAPMNNNAREAINEALGKFSVSGSDEPAAIDAAIVGLKDLVAVAAEAAEVYKPLGNAIQKAYENLEACLETGFYMGCDAFEELIIDVEANYADGLYENEQIAEVVKSLVEAYQECLRTCVDEGADVSYLIANRSFEDLSAQGGANSDGAQPAPAGWTLKVNGEEAQMVSGGWCAINSGDNINVTDEQGVVWNHQYTDGTHVWGIWNSNIPQVELSQKLTGLTPGTYILTADVMARNTDWTGQNLTTQRLFAGDVICMYGSEEDYDPEMLAGTTSDDVYQAWKHYQAGELYDENNGLEYINYAGWNANQNDILLRRLELRFGVGEDGEATIGFRTDNLNGKTGEPLPNQAAGWFKLDNFTLCYESSDVPTRLDAVTVAKAINNKVYDLQGRQVSGAQKGIYIKNGQKVVK